MKIMVVGPTDPDSFADNVIHALTSMGHEVLAAGPARVVRGPRKMRNVSHLLLEQMARADTGSQHHLVLAARHFRPRLVITLDVRLRPATVRGMQLAGTSVVLWFPDHVSNLGKHEVFLCGYDRMYFKNPRLVQQLRDLHGLPAVHLPEAANPAWHHPVGDYGTDRTIVVAGNVHPTRAILLERLAAANIPLRIYGPPISSWLNFPRLRELHAGHAVVREEKAQTFRRARGVLNNLHPAEYAGSNCRLFEATACGAAVLTEWREGMDSLFEAGTEVLDFETFDQLLHRCRQVLNDRELGRTVADAAARRSSFDHTYQTRLGTMLKDLTLA